MQSSGIGIARSLLRFFPRCSHFTKINLWRFARMKFKASVWNGDCLPYATVKYDGIWLHVTRDHAWTSNPTDIAHALQFCTTVRQAMESKHEWFGELHVPQKPASYVKTAIKNEDPSLCFVPFASPQIDSGLSIPKLDLVARDEGLVLGMYMNVHKENCYRFLVDVPVFGEGWVFKQGNLLN